MQNICERLQVGKGEVRDYKQKCINTGLASLRKGKQQIKFKWATLMQVMGTHLKMNIPQRIYRTPLIIGKRQILQLSSGQATNRIKYVALVSREMYETQLKLEGREEEETWKHKCNRTELQIGPHWSGVY